MLSEKSIETSRDLTEILDANKVILYPITGTPLYELTATSRAADTSLTWIKDEGGKPTVSFYPEDILFMANNKSEMFGNKSEHDVAMDRIVDVISTAVRNHLNFARNVVVPQVTSLYEKTTDILKQYSSGIIGMEVKVWNPPKPLSNTTVINAIKKFSDQQINDVKLTAKLPNMTTTEIVDIMKSGSGDLDMDVGEWLATTGLELVDDVWSSIFQSKGNETGGFKQYIYDKKDDDKYLGINRALVVFMLARKLFDNPPADTEMSIDSFNNCMVDYRNQSALCLCNFINDIEKYDRIKQLVLTITDQRVTLVYEPVYREWINNGGENEILFANATLDRQFITVDDITNNSDALRNKWNNHVAVRSLVENNQAFTRTKDILYRTFRQNLLEEVNSDKESAFSKEGIVQEMLLRFQDEVSKLTEDDLKDLWNVCLKLVCRSRHSNTEAERILSGIELVSKNNPKISVREAAAVSTIKYISWWISTQFAKKSI